MISSSNLLIMNLARTASRIVQVFVKEGETVTEGTPLVVVEAMKTVHVFIKLHRPFLPHLPVNILKYHPFPIPSLHCA